MAKYEMAKYKGVYYNKLWKRWNVMIWQGQTQISLGAYQTAEEGHKVRTQAEKLLANGVPIKEVRAALGLPTTAETATSKKKSGPATKVAAVSKPKAKAKPKKKLVERVRYLFKKLTDPKYEKRTSKYEGVGLNRTNGKWSARIARDNKQITIGWYPTEKAALRARRLAEKLLTEGIKIGDVREKVRLSLAAT